MMLSRRKAALQVQVFTLNVVMDQSCHGELHVWKSRCWEGTHTYAHKLQKLQSASSICTQSFTLPCYAHQMLLSLLLFYDQSISLWTSLSSLLYFSLHLFFIFLYLLILGMWHHDDMLFIFLFCLLCINCCVTYDVILSLFYIISIL